VTAKTCPREAVSFAEASYMWKIGADADPEATYRKTYGREDGLFNLSTGGRGKVGKKGPGGGGKNETCFCAAKGFCGRIWHLHLGVRLVMEGA